MADNKHFDTPMLDELENGPWPSFISGFKRLRDDHEDGTIRGMANSLLGQLEHSYETRKGYWKGGTISVYGYGGGIIPRFSEVGIMFIGTNNENIQHFFDDINEYGWDLGGAGPCVRTGMSCVGMARCEMSMCNEHAIHRHLMNNFTDDVHRPALPYKFKFKVSGCPNDCQNAIERSDFAVIGTWRDDMKIDQEEVKAYVAKKGRQHVIDNVTSRCPTDCMTLNDDDTLTVDNGNCVRCMHCLNVMNKALTPGDDRGVTILIGGKRTLKIGDLMGTVLVPFKKLDTMEDYEEIIELAEEIIDFWAENGLEHERCGEMIERIGLVNFIEGIGIEVDPNMISLPRQCSYVRMDGWNEEAIKWFERKAEEASA
jgi:sulfite reductase alpha subunit